MGEDFHPNTDWSVVKNNRWDRALAAFRAHRECVERSADLGPALRRVFESGKPVVVNVIADCDGVSNSWAWTRLKSENLYAWGVDELGPEILQHFHVLPVNALRLRKTAEENRIRKSASGFRNTVGNLHSSCRPFAVPERPSIAMSTAPLA